MKIGIEVEFFLVKDGKIVNVAKAGLPSDEYPLLAEARGNPFDCVFQAVGSVRGEIDRIVSAAGKTGLTPLFADWVKKDDDVEKLYEDILRQGFSKHIGWRNLYGKKPSSKNKRFIAAGLHVSFTEQRSFGYHVNNQPQTFNYNSVFDYPHIFNNITKEFLPEIKASGRVEGFYEVKGDGRVEYRSLPATIIHSPNFVERLARCLK